MGRFVWLAAAVAALTAPATALADRCKPISGTFEAVALQPFTAECPSFFCTTGTLSGDLSGTYFFTAVAPTASGFTGQSTITAKNGVINGQDVSVLFGPPVPGTAFQTTVTFVGGSGKYSNVSGFLVATGTITETGTSGTYSGVLCRGASDEEDEDD